MKLIMFKVNLIIILKLFVIEVAEEGMSYNVKWLSIHFAILEVEKLEKRMKNPKKKKFVL